MLCKLACRILSSQWNGHEMSSCQCLRPQTWLSSVNVLICLICFNWMYSKNWIYLADWPSPGSFVHPKQSRSSGHVPCCSLFTCLFSVKHFFWLTCRLWKCFEFKKSTEQHWQPLQWTTLTLLKKLYAWDAVKTNSAKSSKNRQGKLMQWCSLVWHPSNTFWSIYVYLGFEMIQI